MLLKSFSPCMSRDYCNLQLNIDVNIWKKRKCSNVEVLLLVLFLNRMSCSTQIIEVLPLQLKGYIICVNPSNSLDI